MAISEKQWHVLLNEAEDLCKVYVGKNAESESWGETCDRLERLDKVVKKIRRQQRKAAIDRNNRIAREVAAK